MDGVELEFDTDALEAVATLAIDRNTGARGLRSIMENLMMDIMYDVPTQDNVAKVLINADCVKGIGSPELVKNELIDLDSTVAGELE